MGQTPTINWLCDYIRFLCFDVCLLFCLWWLNLLLAR